MTRRNLAVLLFAAAFLPLVACRRPAPAALVNEISLAETTLPVGRADGVYEATQNWRWTQRQFGFSLDVPRTTRAIYLDLDLTVPDELLEDSPAGVTLSATVNGVEAGRERYVRGGRTHFTRHVSQTALAKTPAAVRFELDRSFTRATDGKELGVIAVAVGLKEYEETAEYRDAQTWAAQQGSDKVLQQVSEQFTPAQIVELRKLFFTLPATRSLQFQGIPIDRNPLDLWNMQQVAFEVRPKFVIDTGVGEGGSALYWAHILNLIGAAESRVLAVDRKNFARKAAAHELWKRYVETVAGDLTDPALVARLAARVKGTPVLVVLDAGQDTSTVLEALRAYSPIVSRGSYLAVEHTEGGPAEAIRRFLTEDAGKLFEIDRNRDMFVLTSSPGGWLRRR